MILEQSNSTDLDAAFITAYSDIEKTATQAIREKEVVGNQILRKEKQDTRFGLVPESLLYGSAKDFLVAAISKLKKVEPEAQFVPDDLLHITLRDLITNLGKTEPGKRRDLITSEKVQKYYQALLEHFPKIEHYPTLTLYKLLPALDPPLDKSGKRAVSIVAAFLTEGDEGLMRAREGIGQAIISSGLELSSSLRAMRVIFSTIGRLRESPREAEGEFPLLQMLTGINATIPPDCKAELKAIDMVITTTVNPSAYFHPSGHIFVWPPIAFRAGEQVKDVFRFIKSRQRALRLPISSNKV